MRRIKRALQEMTNRELIKCRFCSSPVREDRIESHVRRVHGESKREAAVDQGHEAVQFFFKRPCSCGGGNENCFRCGGWGYIDSISEGRALDGALVAGGELRKNKLKNKVSARKN